MLIQLNLSIDDLDDIIEQDQEFWCDDCDDLVVVWPRVINDGLNCSFCDEVLLTTV